MYIVAAIDSFKGSLSSMEAGEAAASGILKADSNAKVSVCPLADGGEGTTEALTSGMGGTIQRVEVMGPLPEQKVTCRYGVVNGQTAVLEMASCSGLPLVPEGKRNPLHTTTYGLGQAILHAAHEGCRTFIIGLGGSATNDGGCGMLQALGYDLLTEEGQPIAYGARGLKELVTIGTDHVDPVLKDCSFRVACDVTNPLCGPKGASAVFGPQKGADPSMVKQLDGYLSHYAAIAEKTMKPLRSTSQAPGAGAAGGLGFAFLTFLNARLESGISIVLEETHLEEKIRKADLVITGEGRLDAQTAMGKAPSGVAALAKKYDCPVVALAGSVTDEATVCNEHGIDAFFPVLRGVCSLEEAMKKETAKKNVAGTAEQVYRLFVAAKR